MTPRTRLNTLLKEIGVDYWCVQGITFWNCDDGRECLAYEYETSEGELHLALKVVGITPEQAIAATMTTEPWEPSKEWKAWHESLRHDSPTNVREVVESILFDAIEFGGDMGPNGNVCSGVDEGDVLTDGCINGWVKSIEAIAATVGKTMTLDEATEYAEKFMGDYAKLLLKSTLYVERGKPSDQHAFYVAEQKEAQMARDLGEALATVGVGTCTIVKTWTDSDYADHWRYSCSECGYQIEVGERDIATGNPTSHANFCWNCGRRCIGIKEVTE